MELTTRHYLSLAALRASFGFLLVWWGLNRVLSPKQGLAIQERYYDGLFPSVNLQQIFGALELAIGLMVVFGILRWMSISVALIICGFSGIMIFPALLDPFNLWLPFDRVSPIQHFFYPTVIAMTSGLLLLAAGDADRYSLDHLWSWWTWKRF